MAAHRAAAEALQTKKQWQSEAELPSQPVHSAGSQTNGIAKNMFIKGLDKYFC